jgi:hypothetical protein
LANPLDPLQALPASARLLRSLRDQFRNLGFVAAAYNAGARRVVDWLEHGRTLPRETRGYVLNITGRSVDEWRKLPADGASLHFVRRLPCRELPEFADLERAQREAQAEQRANAEQLAKAELGATAEQQARPVAQHEAQQQKAKERPHVEARLRLEPERVAERRHVRTAARHIHMRLAERERPHAEHPQREAKQRLRHTAHEGRRKV